MGLGRFSGFWILYTVGSGLEIREYGHVDQSRQPRSTLYPQTLALTLPTSTVARSVYFASHGATEFSFSLVFKHSW
jgi:hypothetical protein